MNQEWITFFKNNYFVFCYGLTLVISIITYRKYFDTELKYFPIIIAYTLFNEILGYFVRYTDNFALFSDNELLTANDLIYNIYEFIFYAFFFWTFWKIVYSAKSKKWILTTAIISLISLIINIFYVNPLHVLLYYGSAISSWGLVICVGIYFNEFKKRWDWNIQKHNLMFWVSCSIAIFYFFFPILSLIGYLNFELWQQLHLRTVLRVLIVLMYSLFIVGFIWSRRKAFR